MINFNELPNSKPTGFLLEKGRYKAKVVSAEMKQGKDASKPPYLNLQYTLTKDNKSMGKFYDIITEPSDADIPRYKLKRFIQAFKLPITDTFTLQDLCKMVPNRECYIDITIDEKSEPRRNQVDVFTGEIYYSVDEIEGAEETATPEINANDAADVDAGYPVEDGEGANY